MALYSCNDWMNTDVGGLVPCRLPWSHPRPHMNVHWTPFAVQSQKSQDSDCFYVAFSILQEEEEKVARGDASPAMEKAQRRQWTERWGGEWWGHMRMQHETVRGVLGARGGGRDGWSGSGEQSPFYLYELPRPVVWVQFTNVTDGTNEEPLYAQLLLHWNPFSLEGLIGSAIVALGCLTALVILTVSCWFWSPGTVHVIFYCDKIVMTILKWSLAGLWVIRLEDAIKMF